MRHFVLIAAMLGATIAPAQTFELADVHISAHSDNPALRIFHRSGRYELLDATMVDLISNAYGIEPDLVSGGPSWLESDRFDIVTKVSDDATAESIRPMLRNLLAERFGLAAHDGQALRRALLLTAGPHPKLAQPGAGGNGSCQDQPSEHTETTNAAFTCTQVTMSAFGAILRNSKFPPVAGYIAGSEVVDQTGLKGAWDFKLKWTGAGLMTKAGADGVTLFDAIDKQLGLQLRMGKVMLPVLIVDKVNRTPTSNAPGISEKLPPLKLEFEVADIHPSQQDHPTAPKFTPGGRLDVRGVTLIALIQHAWGLDTYDNDLIAGGPKWLTTERFDILAKATPPAGPASLLTDNDSIREMLQNLLEDRFQLALHSEDREVTVFALTSVKPKLQQADPSERTKCQESAAPAATADGVPQRMIVCTNVSLSEFAERLHGMAPGYANRPVVDLTGLQGAFDFSLVYSRPGVVRDSLRARADNELAAPSGAISLFEAMEKQLGLKMETQKHPMPVLVIDHIEQSPTN
ncbi:MAG TPA: TIGR03435 family protein [Bryobacteraceae bacterium]|nr:TIGR03435 family protein [Bryobacteraceae bacterium]